LLLYQAFLIFKLNISHSLLNNKCIEMNKPWLRILVLSVIINFTCTSIPAQDIPLPEHPRPDFMREQWLNLNGIWNFKFDKSNIGENEKWFADPTLFDEKIMVPFPWGSVLSGVTNNADIAWYARRFKMPQGWNGKKVFLVVGACDWTTTVWLNGSRLGAYQGGYTPFEFDLTSYIIPDKEQQLVFKVDDSPHPFKLEGKQGYGQAKGIWQTVYIEARGANAFRSIHFIPDIDASSVLIHVNLNAPVSIASTLKLRFLNSEQSQAEHIENIPKGVESLDFKIDIKNEHLWNLDDPYLYDVELSILQKNLTVDKVQSYFGMRKISVTHLPGLNYPYVALNNKPVYLQLTLDQSYNPQGFYTFPSDQFMKEEILRSKKIGLNGNRIHIKVEVPRKLYWADKLGLLIMADVPNSWGEPDSEMQKEWETAMQGMIERDFNHPSIFQWVLFNETWGLFTKQADNKSNYLPETQQWVEKMYRTAKKLDPSRLVEDNSACNNDHVSTDVNTWHMYLPGYEWKKVLDDIDGNTYPGSGWNFVNGRKQAEQPMFNSECGNVWGYDGSTGDVDWSWDYHRMMNEFRAHPKTAGWLYTEHHDVINEWNGYYRYDRSNKYTGLEELVPGMTLNDFHSAVYLSLPGAVCRSAKPAERVEVPMYISCMTDKDYGKKLSVFTELYGWDFLGRKQTWNKQSFTLDYKAWMNEVLPPYLIQMPNAAGLAILVFVVKDEAGNELHHNFTCFRIGGSQSPRQEVISDAGNTLKIVRFAPSSFDSANWSLKQWNIFDGLKVNGAGFGYFEYKIDWPAGLKVTEVEEVSLILEASSKELFGKDVSNSKAISGDYMRGGGAMDGSKNSNSYPMTDDKKFPSLLRIRVNGESVGSYLLADDPADHRGILSWFAQPANHKLNEAGSYGFLIHAIIPSELLIKAEGKKLTIRFEVDASLPGGLAIYGENFGRYPLDPTLVFKLKQ
jgi:hypothetical protein